MIFSVGSSKDGVKVGFDETLPDTDIMAMLEFSDDQIEDLLHTHAANQAYWEAFAIRLKTRAEEFKENFVKRWWAHNKTFAKLVLAAYGDAKPTVDGIVDQTIIMYSNITEIQRQQFADAAYSVASKRPNFSKTKEEFFADMFLYKEWTYELLIGEQKRLQENSEIVSVVAERLNSKSFHLGQVLSLIQAKAAHGIDSRKR